MIKVPKFKTASKAAEWIVGAISKSTWTTGALATTRDDSKVSVKNPDAVKFCAIGWIKKANQGFEKNIRTALTKAIESAEDFDGPNDSVIIDFNDDSAGYGRVKAAFRKAAKLLAQQELAAKKAAKTKAKKAS